MSRSAFSARFTELVGESAMQYVTRWQMNAARSRLAEGDVTVAEIAHSFGYESESAFNRAFKRHLGISPGAAKRDRCPRASEYDSARSVSNTSLDPKPEASLGRTVPQQRAARARNDGDAGTAE
jgi:AraC-like DNA-binding protein